MKEHILIVEDEPDMLMNLEYAFEKEGYQPITAGTGKEALQRVNNSPMPDLIVLDLMLPDISGNEVCRQVRQSEKTKLIPVIMLTAKGEEIDRVVGFEVGADDYVTKPFSTRELVLRVKAVLRRSRGESEDKGILQFGRLRVEQASHRVWVNEEELNLTALEFRLLLTFLTRKGRVQSRETLLSDVWGINAEVMTRTIDTHVKRLREKLGVAGEYIETLRGVGYRFKERP